MLAAAGAGLGLLVAQSGSALLVRQLATATDAVTLDLTPDWRVLAFTAAVAAITAIVFGTAPALGIGRVSAQDAIKAQTRTMTAGRRVGVRDVFVAMQVALSLALVIGGLLFVRTLTALSSTSLGFAPQGLTSIDLDARASHLEPAARQQLFERMRESVAAVPGVSGAALSVLIPIGWSGWNTVIGPTPLTAGLTVRQRLAWVNGVSPGWFDTFGMRLIGGRDFDAHDSAGAPPVMIVNESFARRFFGDSRKAIGQEIRSNVEGTTGIGYRIVGLVNDAVYKSLRKGFEPTVFVPLAQLHDMPAEIVVTARAAGGSDAALSHDLVAAITRTDAQVAFTVHPVPEQLRGAVRQERLTAMLAGFFGSLALVLAAVGLYGVVSHAVARRRAEIGIRMALGADPRGVVRLVLGRLLVLLATGMVLGVALSWWTVALFEQLLFGLRPRDPLTFIVACGVLALVGCAAGWMPARRAARIDPVQTLREA